MYLFTKLPPLLFLLAISLPFALAGYSIDQFKHWYPEFGFIFSHILATNCTAPYATYLLAQKHPIAADDPDRYTGLGQTNQLAQPVVKCILDSTSSFVMANMGSAQVLLGLTPTILATLGPSSEETSMLFVIARRPVLAVLLAAGSPAVFATRSFEVTDPLRLLKDRESRSRLPNLSSRIEITVMITEYVFALAAIANIITLGYELGVQVVCSFTPHSTYIPLLWGFLSLSVHASGVIAFAFKDLLA
jgi:hypothetical protein